MFRHVSILTYTLVKIGTFKPVPGVGKWVVKKVKVKGEIMKFIGRNENKTKTQTETINFLPKMRKQKRSSGIKKVTRTQD